jgi:hypothetical protein
MFDIRLDQGDAPSVFAAMRNPQVAQHVANAAAEAYVTDIHDWIAGGHAFASHHGQLEQSINWRPVTGGRAQIYANADFAPYVEAGTGIPAGHSQWVIAPLAGRKALKIPEPGGGGFFFRRSVIHRGSRAFPFFFADTNNRETDMGNAARSVLAHYIGNGHG